MLTLPEPALVLLIGASGSGKTTFARKHFALTEVVSSDHCRALVCDDEADQSVTPQAFAVLLTIVRSRLRLRRFTVVDATNVQLHARSKLLALAWQFDIPAVGIVLRCTQDDCVERNVIRAGRVVSPDVIRQQTTDLERSLPSLGGEGFESVHLLESTDGVQIIRRGSSVLPS